MKIKEEKVNIAKDILDTSSDIEIILAITYLKRLKKYEAQIKENTLKIKELDLFIIECLDKYLEIKDIIDETSQKESYLQKKEYYLNRLSQIELGIYTHVLLLKNKIEDIKELIDLNEPDLEDEIKGQLNALSNK